MFIDESTKTLEDAYFAIQVDNRVWQNSPTDRHDRGATLSLADGHSEIYKWKVASTGRVYYNEPAGAVNSDFDKVAATIATKK